MSVSIRSTDNVSIECDHIVLGPIIDRDKRVIANYMIELDKIIEIQSNGSSSNGSNKINFKQLKEVLIEKKVKMTGMKMIDTILMSEDQMIDDLDQIHMELKRARSYAEKNNSHQIIDMLNDSPYKLFRMKDQSSFEKYIDDIEKILERREREQTEQVAQKINNIIF